LSLTRCQIFTSTQPWGVLSEKHIFQLVVREGERPERPDPAVEARSGLTNHIWEVIETAWQQESRLRPNFEQLLAMWPNSSVFEPQTPLDPDQSESVLNFFGFL
jgi:hypothetical protein